MYQFSYLLPLFIVLSNLLTITYSTTTTPPQILLNTTFASDGDIVLVNISNPSLFSPLPGIDWVGIYSYGSSLDAIPLKLSYLVPTATNYNISGMGSLLAQVWNVRQPLEFRLLTNGTTNPILLASTLLQFYNYGALLHPRVLPGVDMAYSSSSSIAQAFRVAWTSNASYPSSVLKWGTQKGGPYPFLSNATGSSISRSALYSPPATTVGFFDLGVTLHALINIPTDTAIAYPQRIYYRAFDNVININGSEWEGSFIIPPLPNNSLYPFSLIAFGDLGRGSPDNFVTTQEYGAATQLLIPYLINEIENHNITAIHLFGDLSYAVGYLGIWDEYLGLISPFASSVVHIVGVGNHEAVTPNSSSWSLYGNANDSGGEGNVVTSTLFPFPTPANVSSPYFLYASGPISLIVLSSEHDFTMGSAQYTWLNNTLSLSINRTITPWLIVTCHRQPYMDTILSDTYNFTGNFAAYIEPLLLQYQVNAVLVGHAHKWERLSAIYQNQTMDVSVPTEMDGNIVHIFHQPKAPVYYIAGTGGADFIKNDCRRYRLPPYNWNCTVPLWSEAEGYDHGYLRITAINSTALGWKYLSTANGTKAGDVIIDEVMIVL